MGTYLNRQAAAAILGAAAAAGPRRGTTTVVAIDGPAGSGKTTLAGAVETLALEGPWARVQVLAMDDLYPGWTGLRAGGDLLRRRVLAPLARGEAGSYERYDWHAGRYAETHEVPGGGLLVVEGVGSVRTGHAAWLSVVVEVREPDAATRLRRWRERDGPDADAHAPAWIAAEDALHAETRLADLATIRLDGHGRLVEGNVRSREQRA